MNKTIYVKDNALWDRAGELAGKLGRSLSDVINELLGDWTCAIRTVNSLTTADKSGPRNQFVEIYPVGAGISSVRTGKPLTIEVAYRWTGWKESQVTRAIAGQWLASWTDLKTGKRLYAYSNAGDPAHAGPLERGQTFNLDNSPTPDWDLGDTEVARLQELRSKALVKLRDLVKQELGVPVL